MLSIPFTVHALQVMPYESECSKPTTVIFWIYRPAGRFEDLTLSLTQGKPCIQRGAQYRPMKYIIEQQTVLFYRRIL